MRKFIIAGLSSVALAGCGGNDDSDATTPTPTPTGTPNSAPVLVGGSIPDQVIARGVVAPSLNLASFVRDPDGDSLTFELTNDRPDLVAVTVSSLGVLGIQLPQNEVTGRAQISFRVADGRGGLFQSSFAIIIQPRGQNLAPRVSRALPDVQFELGQSAPVVVSLDGLFQDANNDALTLDVSNSNPSVATAALSANQGSLEVSVFSEGRSRITLTASDIDGAVATTSFDVVAFRLQSGRLTGISPASFGLAPGARAKPINLRGQFRNVSGDLSGLGFAASTTDPAIATVELDAFGNAFVIATAEPRDPTGNPTLGQSAIITINAQDVDGATGFIQFAVTISADAPTALCALQQNSAVPLPFGQPSRLPLQCSEFPNANDGDGSIITLQAIPGLQAQLVPDVEGGVFADQPAGSALRFSADTTSASVAVPVFDPATNQFSVQMTGAAGNAVISIVAEDEDGNSNHQFFTVSQSSGITVPVAFRNLPSINIERDAAQTFQIRLADFVGDLDPNDGDADLSPLLAQPCPAGSSFANYRYRLAVNPDASIATARALLPVAGDPLSTDTNLGQFEISVLPALGSTSLQFEVRDCDGDFTNGVIAINVTEPAKEILVVRGADGNAERVVSRLPASAVGSTPPTGIFDFDMAGGIALDESGSLIQVGRLPSNAGVIDSVPAIRLMHNALNRAPRLRSGVVGGVVAGQSVPSVRWSGSIDRQINSNLPATDIPQNVVYENMDGHIAVIFNQVGANTANFAAVRIYTPEAGANALPIQQIRSSELHNQGAASFADAWDAAYAPGFDSFYITMTNGSIVRCDQFLARIRSGLSASCQFDHDNNPNTGQLAQVLRPQVECINTDNAGSTTNCQRDLRGIDYVAATDSLVVSDAGPLTAAIVPAPVPAPQAPDFDQDGSIYVFHQVSLSDLALNAGFVPPDLTIRNTGNRSTNVSRLGNPLDVVVDGADLLVAENINPDSSNIPGAVLRFSGLAAVGAASGVSEIAPTAVIHQSRARSLAVFPVPAGVDDASDLDNIVQLPGLVARRNQVSNVMLSSTNPANGAGVVRQYGLSYDLLTGAPSAPPLAVPVSPRGIEIVYASSAIAGVDISVSSEVIGTVTGGPQANQPGGLLAFGARNAASPLTLSTSRVIQSPVSEETTDLVAPKGLDLVQDLGLVIVADFRAPGSSPAGAIQVFSYGTEANASPIYSTLLANRKPWDLDYDPIADRLFVVTTDGSILIFDEYIARFSNGAANRHLNADRARVVVPSVNGNRVSVNLHGIVHHRPTDANGNISHEELILSDVGNAADATDGQLFVMTLASPATANGKQNVDLVVANLRDGPSATALALCDAGLNAGFAPNGQAGDPILGNPVDVAYDPLQDVAFVAEKSNKLLVQFGFRRNSATNKVNGFAFACTNIVNDLTGTPTGTLNPEAVQIRPNFLP